VTELESGVLEGEILAHKYRIDRVLGAGAMGVVVAAHHLGLDTRVAIKLMRRELWGNEEAVVRFSREARAAAKLTSEHVARVLDVGVLETGAPYMVMEFLDGADLHKWLALHGPLPVEQAVDFVLQASEAIAEAHQLGIVHRDLKPSNLFCVPRTDGTLCIKVLDFGISKMSIVSTAGSNVSMTRTATVIGTPLYMSPEQMESSRGVDARADVWALGVILFELLAGKSPFYADSLPEVCLKIATRPPPPLRDLRGDAPRDIEVAILKCLQKDREGRFQSVADYYSAIAPFGSGDGRAAAERIRRSMLQASGRPETMTAVASAQGMRRVPALESIGAVENSRTGLWRRQPGVVGAVAVTVAIVGVASAMLMAHMSGSASRATPAPAAASVVDNLTISKPENTEVPPAEWKQVDPPTPPTVAPSPASALDGSTKAAARTPPPPKTGPRRPGNSEPEPSRGPAYDERL
jgi:serine/threonine-protein kinase